ncbi:MAG: hypothetical protein KQJ78_25680, partial [Deltaproteobacteria bacterium]|nr:hypothetical protein [Deltaproteobacteria bacterium]
MAAAIVASGSINVLKSLRFDLLPFGQFNPLMGLGKSLAILANSTQAILGIGLVLVGLGLLRRLAAAWSFGVILLLVTLGVDLSQQHWNRSLILPGVLLLAMLVLRRHFSRQTDLANYAISLTGIFSILAYG